ncbi:MAG: DNA adenine methylase [Pedobacter sp.]|nr:DNA adenine methylase [Pedobacter sp.]
MDKKVRPIIKWTGGKYREFALFAGMIPKFERYIEPFFGGGGVFFALQPNVPSFLNDKSTDLINFYQQINQPALHQALLKYANAWDELSQMCLDVWENLQFVYIDFIADQVRVEELQEKMSKELKATLKELPFIRDVDLICDEEEFGNRLFFSAMDKARRIQVICKKEARNFNPHEIYAHFETGLKSGFYLYFRSILNENFIGQIKLEKAQAAANWYFVREFCYGSMFRFNAKGEFNIPYGGITYNKKNFRQKVDYIFSPKIRQIFQASTISNLDFEVFLKNLDLSQRDFIFLDPPYDSEFSEYDQSAFTQADQRRLAGVLLHIKAKWMVVIKDTAFIREIYSHPSLKISFFYKNYTYNVRGRNDRKVQHLIITNY